MTVYRITVVLDDTVPAQATILTDVKTALNSIITSAGGNVQIQRIQ